MMGEFKRVLFSRGVALVLVAVAAVNLFLFYRQQQDDNWGFPASNVIDVPVDAETARNLYNELEQRYHDADLDTALTEVQVLADEEALYKDLQSLLQSWELYGKDDPNNTQWVLYYEDDYEEAMEQWPEEMEKLRAGWEPDWVQMKVQTKAASKLADQLAHLTQYRDYPSQVQAACERLGRFSIFGKKGSFANRNLYKTAEDFAPLDGANLALGHDEAITSLFSYPLADWLLVLVLIYTALTFLDERQKGLWHVLYAAPGGRAPLALRRMGILALVSAAATVLLHGGVLALGFLKYGGLADLDRAAQSLAIFKTLPVVTSAGGLLVRYFLLRAITGFVLGLLLWLLSAANTGVRWMIVGLAVFLAAEYSCYTLLPDQSVFQLLKYGNIFSYIDLSVLFTRYLNLDFLTFPVNIRMLVEASCIPLALLLGGGCAVLQARMRPRQPAAPFARLGLHWNAFWDAVRSHLRLTGFEAYKLLIMQGGVLVLAVFFVLIFRLDIAAQISRTEADEYALKLQGPLTEEKLAEIDATKQEIDDRYNAVLTASDRLQSGEIDWYEFSDIVSGSTNVTAEQAGIKEVQLRTEALAARGEELDTTLWLLDDAPYQGIYGNEASSLRIRWNVLVLFALSLLLAGSMAADQTAGGLRHLLRAGAKGRAALLLRKYLLTGCGVVLLWAAPTAMEWKVLMSSVDPVTLDAPVQSVRFLVQFPLPISIGQFLMGLYLFRLLALLALGCIVLFLSSLFHRPEGAYVAACAALVIPTALWSWLGLEPLRFLSAARATDLIGLLTERQGQPTVAIAVTAALLLLGAASCFATWRGWQGPHPMMRRRHGE